MTLLQTLSDFTSWAGGIEKLGIIGVLILTNVGQWYLNRNTIKKLQADNDKLSDFILSLKGKL